MYIDLTMAMTQTALIVLKLLDRFDRSWWFVFIPTIAWIFGGIIMVATDKEDSESGNIQRNDD